MVLTLALSGLVHAEEPAAAPTAGPAAPLLGFKKPEIAKKLERLYEKITATGFYPTIRDLAAGTGIGPGLTFWKPRPFGGPVGILGTIGWNPRVFLLEARLGRVPSRPGKIPDRRFTLEALTTDAPEGTNHRWFLFLEARRLDILDDRLYFALGPDGTVEPAQLGSSVRFLEDSPDASTVHFDAENDDTDLVGGYHFRKGLAASARVGYVNANTTFDPDEASTPGLPTIPGVNETTDFARVRLDFIFDRRDVRNHAHRGVLLHGTWLHMDQRGGTLYGFDRFELDARAFLSTRSRRHTLALPSPRGPRRARSGTGTSPSTSSGRWGETTPSAAIPSSASGAPAPWRSRPSTGFGLHPRWSWPPSTTEARSRAGSRRWAPRATGRALAPAPAGCRRRT